MLLGVGWAYRAAPAAAFFEDDHHWLVEGLRLHPSYLWRIDLHTHFYRPVIALYFHLGTRLAGCTPAAFHVASVVVHLLATGAVYLLVSALARRRAVGATAAMLFAVQPGFVEAVVWVGAITDLLPALFYVVTLWLHLRLLEGAGPAAYAALAATFVTCLLTHESSATLLPMMMALELTLLLQGRVAAPRLGVADRVRRYAPLTALLLGYLAIEYVVNTRSYIVREGYYTLGPHMAANALRYVRWLIVWRPGVASALAIGLGAAALLWKGNARLRFAVLWMAVTMAPVLPFTWGTASRYLYLPAVGFCILQAEGAVWLYDRLRTRLSPLRAAMAVGVLVAVVAGRAAVFAERGVREFAARSEAYGAFTDAVRARYPVRPADGQVAIAGIDTSGMAPLYVEPAVQVAFCDVTVALRR